MPLLLQLLRAEIPAAPSRAECLLTLQLAEQENVLPSCVAAMRRLPIPASELQDRMAEIEREIRFSTFWWTSELSGILSALSHEEIPVILLKGPLLAQRIYGDLHLRTSRDIDLLVPRSGLKAAANVFAKLGFASSLRPDDYHGSWRRGTTLVELHHNVENPLAFRFHLDDVWKRARPIAFSGQPVYQLAAADELCFLALHGVRHRFERLSHVLDLALAFETLLPQVPPDWFSANQSRDLRSLLLLGHAMAKYMRFNLPALPIPVANEHRRHLESIAAARWNALLQAPAPFLDWSAQHRFYLEIEPTAVARLHRSIRHSLILSTRLIQADFDFAARFRIRQPLFVWMLRPLRLLTKIKISVSQQEGG